MDEEEEAYVGRGKRGRVGVGVPTPAGWSIYRMEALLFQLQG